MYNKTKGKELIQLSMYFVGKKKVSCNQNLKGRWVGNSPKSPSIFLQLSRKLHQCYLLTNLPFHKKKRGQQRIPPEERRVEIEELNGNMQLCSTKVMKQV